MWKACLLLTVAILQAAAQDQDQCSGHGSVEDGKCVCSTPMPTAGASGWVGAQCEQEVKLLPVDGSAAEFTLAAGSAMCWAATMTGATVIPNYFATSITLAAGSTGGLQLYGLLATDLASLGPLGPQTLVYPHAPPGQGSWDYLLEVGPGPGQQPHKVLQLHGAAAVAVQQQGIFLCTSNPPNTSAISATLRAAGHSCPLTLHDNGFISICSSTPEDVRYSTDTCPAGVCACVGVYRKPASPVADDLGFEDCSAVVESLADATGPEPITVTVASHPPDTWHFFNFTLAEGQQHLALTATASRNTASRVYMQLRPLQPPGGVPGTWVARTDWADFSGDLALSLQVGPGLPGPTLTPGLWYVGVHVLGDDAAAYSLTIRRSACAGFGADCSGRGTCDATTGACTCASADYVGPDCANSQSALALGMPVSAPPRGFGADVLTMTGLAAQLALPTVALNITASFNTKDPLPDWVTLRPLLLIAPGHPSADAPLTPDTAPHKLVLQVASTQYSLTLDPSQVPDGELYLVVHNPLSAPYEVGYTVAADLVGRCLDDCSGHGTCGADGRCQCQEGWLGASCSVDGARNTTDACQPGSRLPIRREEQKATCWAACNADTGKYDEATCVDFSCDPTAADGRPQRRAGTQQACVTDLCSPAAGPNVTLTDPSGTFVCDRACVCPADGGACAPDAACLPGSQRCLDGLVATTGPDGTTQCVQPSQPGTCEEGSLKQAANLPGGAAFAVCVCSGGQCGWTALSDGDIHGGHVDPSKGVVTCQPGYQVVGAQAGGLTLSDGRQLTSGGACERIHIRRGTSGGMVFFWCLFSVALAATMVVGGRRFLDWYEARRWDMGDDDLRVGLLDRVRLGVTSLVGRRGTGGGSSAADNHW